MSNKECVDCEYGMSIGDIFRTIGKKIWIALVIGLAFALFVLAVTGLFLNKKREKYVMTFELECPKFILNEEISEKMEIYSTPDYIDNVRLTANFPTLKDLSSSYVFSKDNMQEIIDFSEGFSYLSAEELAANGYIYNDSNEKKDYSLVFSANKFDSYDDGFDFLEKVVNNLGKNLAESIKTEDFLGALKSFDACTTAEDKLNCLRVQKQYLLDEYNFVSSYYGTQFISNGKTLQYYIDGINAVDLADTDNDSVINGYRDKLLSETENFASVLKSVYSTQMQTGEVGMYVDGNISPIKALALGFVLGAVCSIVVLFIVERVKAKKQVKE